MYSVFKDCYEEQNLNGGDHIVGEAGAAGAVFDKHLVQQTSVPWVDLTRHCCNVEHETKNLKPKKIQLLSEKLMGLFLTNISCNKHLCSE